MLQSRTTRDSELTWSAAPLKELLALAWPIAVTWTSYSVMTLVGTLFVGHLGPAALAGVGVGGTVSFSLLCFGMGMLRGAKILVSQAVGAGRRDDHHPILAAALAWSLVLAVLTIALGELAAHWLPRVAASAASGEAAASYVRVRMLSAPFFLAAVALREVRYGVSDSKSPMSAALWANLTNIASDWLLISILEFGVVGAAWSTVVAGVVEVFLLLRAQRRDGLRLGRTSRSDVVSIWKLGAPTGLQFIVESGSFVLLALILASISEAEMAAHQIAIQVIHFSFLPAFAVAEAASVLVGQAVGADRDDLVVRVSRKAFWVTGAYTLACGLVFVLLGTQLVRPFSPDWATRETAIRLLVIAAVFQVFDAANIVARSVLRGVGDVRFAAAVGIFTAWFLTPPSAWLLGLEWKLGAFGGWLGLCAEIILGAVILWHRLERGRWKKHAELARIRLSTPPEPVAAT